MAPSQHGGRAANPAPECPAQAKRYTRGPAPARPSAEPAPPAALFRCPVGHLRRSGETRARSPAAPGPSALLLQRPAASGEGKGRRPPPPSVEPGSHFRALQVRSGGPAASRAGPQYSAHAQASVGPELAHFTSIFPSAPPERWS
ncbi:hypothetical protein NDU88_002365 [Pleurodeles waltl]|uniref:Uncharacterized protein n=1 Tax=Pleurodeles waltl TaxID=8319 RepID=A0AAV7UCY3_PLEWA|nr:hypothetical protein NDU88_002365 [Pleurodeles waltl]